MRGFLYALTTLWLATVTVQLPNDHPPTQPTAKCNHISLPRFSDFYILSVSANPVYNYSLPIIPSLTSKPVSGLDFCRIVVTLAHTDDIVNTWIWLPLENWNGRFVVEGGGGLVAGYEESLATFAAEGYAAGATDAGLTLNGTIDPSTGAWAIRSPGVLNTDLIENFAHRSIHDTAVLGKATVATVYGEHPKYSYYDGCSTGGRQGYLSAQRHPDDFDGITANAPAIYTPRVSPGDFWPSVVMGNLEAPPKCVFTAYQAAIISACDILDGAIDQLVGLPEKCHYDTRRLIGSTIDCSETNSAIAITAVHAQVVDKILQGARSHTGEWLWYGVPPGASFSGLANTRTRGGVTVAVPFESAQNWISYFIFQDPDYDTVNMTFADFELAYERSVALFTDTMGTDDPDLRQFKRLGKKLVTWHGTADEYISPEGTLRYRKALESRLGGSKEVNEFQRLFFAPGAGHCAAGEVGPAPIDPLTYLAAWVENDPAPTTLYAAIETNGTITIDRNLCPYPQILRYKGSGDVRSADSFYCA